MRVKAFEGLRPSFSAHVRWCEHGAPVRSCGAAMFDLLRRAWSGEPSMFGLLRHGWELPAFDVWFVTTRVELWCCDVWFVTTRLER